MCRGYTNFKGLTLPPLSDMIMSTLTISYNSITDICVNYIYKLYLYTNSTYIQLFYALWFYVFTFSFKKKNNSYTIIY